MADITQEMRVVEALLFAATEPVSTDFLAERLPEGSDIGAILEDLKGHYEGRGVNIARVAGKWCLRTAEDLSRALALMTERGAVAWHTGSLVSWLGDGADALIDAWHRARERGDMTLSYDPNIRPGVQRREIMRGRVEQFISAAHIVKASDEDGAYLYPDVALDDVCAQWAASGPNLVVLTRGEDGATVWRGDEPPMSVPGYPAVVADTVGAGDTVSAALLAGLSNDFGRDSADRLARLPHGKVRAVVEFALAAAAITCSRPGADPPSSEEVIDFFA
jgi:fructokinase